MHDKAGQHAREQRLAIYARERRHLLCVAFRILGSQVDAEDVVQETWIKYDRTDTSDVQNLPAWLTTVASRLCIDVLRRRRDISQEEPELLDLTDEPRGNDPEQTTLLATELATAFTIVAVAPDDSPNARRVVEAFLRAVQEGNTNDLVALLDPNVIRFADPQALPPGAAQRIQGVHAAAEETARFRATAARARISQIDGRPGILISSGSDCQFAIAVRVIDERIVQYDVIADPQRLALLHITP